MSDRLIDTRLLRNALGRFATGVAIVTALDEQGQPVGLTINSFAAVSLEPALVLWSLDNSSQNLTAFAAASHHAINILTADQTDLSNRFANYNGDRFAGLAYAAGQGGAPVFPGCCAVFEVANETQLPGGDHTIFLGRVQQFSENSEVSPLLFFGGQYAGLKAEE